MKPNHRHLLIVISLGCAHFTVSCASQEQEAPPTAREEAESARDRAQEQAEIAHKYARWTTPQLIAERDDLAKKINNQGPMVGGSGAIGVIALVEHAQRKRFNELNDEIARRQAIPKPTQR